MRFYYTKSSCWSHWLLESGTWVCPLKNVYFEGCSTRVEAQKSSVMSELCLSQGHWTEELQTWDGDDGRAPPSRFSQTSASNKPSPEPEPGEPGRTSTSWSSDCEESSHRDLGSILPWLQETLRTYQVEEPCGLFCANVDTTKFHHLAAQSFSLTLQMEMENPKDVNTQYKLFLLHF